MRKEYQKIVIAALIGCVWIAGLAPSAGAAVLTGKVLFEGEAPVPKPLNFGAEKQCAMMHADKAPMTEDLIVNPNQTVKWALIYVKTGAPVSAASAETLEIGQKGCIFEPHVVVARTGQKVIFKNDDPVLHNVRSESKINRPFNIAQPIQGMTTTKIFEKPEVGIRLRCDVHFWMASFISILDHPFYAVTGDDGSYQIKDLPAGTYTIELWHEKLGTQTAEITVADGETKTSDFTLKLS